MGKNMILTSLKIALSFHKDELRMKWFSRNVAIHLMANIA